MGNESKVLTEASEKLPEKGYKDDREKAVCGSEG